MKVLIGCENSGTVRDAFRVRGHDAWSNDLLPSDEGGPHYQCDFFEAVDDDDWDLVIVHPPCTFLSSSGIHWNNRGRGWEGTRDALEFVKRIFTLITKRRKKRKPVPRLALENPNGIISTNIRPPDQIIQPNQFGDDASKATGFWLHRLPKLRPTKNVPPRWACCGEWITGVPSFVPDRCPICHGANQALPRWANQTVSGQNKIGRVPDRWKLRSETFQGVADAMADQWGAEEFLTPVKQSLLN